MEESGIRPSGLEILLYVVGGGCLVYSIWKGYLVGYYPSEEAVLFGALAIGAVSLLWASKLAQGRRKRSADMADRAKGIE